MSIEQSDVGFCHSVP